MKSFCCFAVSLALLGLAVADRAQADAKPVKNQNPGSSTDNTNPNAPDPLTAPLVAADMLAKLKLSADQKKDVADLSKEFSTKLKETVAKAQDDAKKDGGSAPPAPAKGAKPVKGAKGAKGAGGKGKTSDGDPVLKAALDLRSDYEDKLMDKLTETQQQTWLNIKAKAGEALLTGAKGDTTPAKPKK